MQSATALSRAILLLLALVASWHGPLFAADDYTPVLVTAQHAQTQIFPGTDGKRHIAYELMLTNAIHAAVPLKKVEVVDAANTATVLASYEGPALLAHLRKMANGASETAELEVDGSRILFVDVAFPPGVTPPAHVVHRLTIVAVAPGAASDVPGPQSYSAAPVEIMDHVLTIGPPLTGSHWVAINGCCGPSGAHRGAGIPLNGSVHFAQRFAIDWMQLDGQGRLLHGDESDVHDYTDYGAQVIAVADGTVVETLDSLSDQKPPNGPDPKTITLLNVGGNHIIEDLGHGVFAFYAHMQKGSIGVKPGDRVKRGQALGRLGNTGNTSGPHLHFHLMDGPSMLGSSGLPYAIDSFSVAGQLSPEQFAAATSLAGSWNTGLLAAPSPRHDEFPMDTVIVNFGKN